ncbi:hypothetical protein ACFVU2_10180 [Leifsonia sp. NPDC058194]|uniref:hypothetical protein n=1 Tax=Leifsonia sp. NPDC058194 TaxID=3346374 RepID=UPI0036DD740C
MIGSVAWLLGMDAPHAVGLAAVAIALAGSLALVGEQSEVAWSAPDPVSRPGSRRDVAQLGWSVAVGARGLRGGRASSDAVRRLRGLAAEALALRGIGLDDPDSREAVAGLLGEETAALLRRGSGETPSTAAFVAALARIEALGSAVDRGGG